MAQVDLSKIEQNWLAISIKENQSLESCKLAFSKNKSSFKYFSDEFKDQSMCLEAVKYNGDFVKHVPEHLQNPEIVAISLKYEVNNFIHVFHQTEEMCFEVVCENSNLFQYCLFKSDRIIEKAIEGNFENIVYIDHIEQNNVNLALKQITPLSYPSEHFINKIKSFLNSDDIWALLMKKPDLIEFLDQNVDLCLKLLKEEPQVYQKINIVSESKTPEECLQKLESKKKLIDLVSN